MFSYALEMSQNLIRLKEMFQGSEGPHFWKIIFGGNTVNLPKCHMRNFVQQELIYKSILL